MTFRYRTLTSIVLAGVALASAAACQATPSAPTVAPPAPTAVPAAEKAPAAAAAVPVSNKLIIHTDVVQGSKNLTEEQKAVKSCVLNSRFPRNSEIVWRSRVIDPRTGEPMGEETLSAVEIRLANGTNIKMKYGPHPKDPPGESFWTGSFLVPKDFPTGTLLYTIVAMATDGRIGEFKPFSVASSQLTILDEVIPDVVPPAKPKS